jgi:predicted MPP superfamily phosphohydrolase
MKISRKKFIVSASGLFVSGLLFDSFFIEKYIFEENYFPVSVRQGNSENPVKVLQITDLHLNAVGFGMRKLARRITEISPDIICITGDAIDHKGNIHILDEFLRLLPNSIPKVATLGNWEHMTDVNLRDLNYTYKKNNCSLLVNERIVIKVKGRNVLFTGIDEHTHGKPDFDKSLSNYKQEEIHVMLFHSPAYIDLVKERLKEQKFKNVTINLALSGHTHGGQINLGGYIPYLPPGSKSYIKGWFKDQNPPLYVSKGIGTTILPLRLGAPSEITVFIFS